MSRELVSNPGGFPGGSVVRNLPASAGNLDSILGWEVPLEKEMAVHSSILAWERGKRHRGVWWATVHGAAKSQT